MHRALFADELLTFIANFYFTNWRSIPSEQCSELLLETNQCIPNLDDERRWKQSEVFPVHRGTFYIKNSLGTIVLWILCAWASGNWFASMQNICHLILSYPVSPYSGDDSDDNDHRTYASCAHWKTSNEYSVIDEDLMRGCVGGGNGNDDNENFATGKTHQQFGSKKNVNWLTYSEK